MSIKTDEDYIRRETTEDKKISHEDTKVTKKSIAGNFMDSAILLFFVAFRVFV